MASADDKEDHHVHFEANDVLSHDNNIHVVQKGENSIDVHIGFLQIHHKYEITVAIPSDYLAASDMQLSEPANLGVRIVKMEKANAQVLVTFEVAPPVEKLYREKISLEDEGQRRSTNITLHYRVLGKGKGTPMLKNGIKCVQILPDPNESDANSDWQGF